jgi:hypothetical protein
MAANRRAAAESAKDDDADSSEVCTPLRFFFLCIRCFEPSCVLLAQLPCEVCQKNDRGEEMLLCDNCDCGTPLILFLIPAPQ